MCFQYSISYYYYIIIIILSVFIKTEFFRKIIFSFKIIQVIFNINFEHIKRQNKGLQNLYCCVRVIELGQKRRR